MKINKKNKNKDKKLKISKFRFCKDDKTFEAEQNDEDWDDGFSESSSLREIAYQLKSIAESI